MEEIFEDLAGFLMHEEVQTDSNAAEILAGEGIDDHMVPTGGTISSFCNGIIDDHELEDDWYTQFLELDFLDHHHQSGEELMYDDHPSNDIRPDDDNLLLDVNDYFQENDCLIDQYIHDNNCHPQSSASVVVPHIDDSVLSIDIVNDDPTSIPEQQVQDGRQERRSKLLKKPNAKRPKRRKKDKQVNHGEEEEGLDDELGADIFSKGAAIDIDNYEEDIGDDINQSSSVVTKNLVSERNRRKRFNQQLFALRGLVPCITKMDKRSVLVDALAYLQDILQQTQTEIEAMNNNTSCAAAGTEDPPGHHAIVDSRRMSPDSLTENVQIHPPCHHLGVILENNVISASVEGDHPQPMIMSRILEPSTTPYSAVFPAITKMEAEKVDGERYMLKIVYNNALGAMSQVQRSVEMLKGFDFINISLSEYDEHHMQSSTLLRVKKIKGSLPVTDEENLLERVKLTAEKLGLNLPCDV